MSDATGATTPRWLPAWRLRLVATVVITLVGVGAAVFVMWQSKPPNQIDVETLWKNAITHYVH